MRDPEEGADAGQPAVDEVAELLHRSASGDATVLDELMPRVYSQLRAIARRLRRRGGLESPTWNTTAIVNEAYLKLAKGSRRFVDRVHFFALASTAMRQLLIDEARRRTREKRGGDAVALSLDEARIAIDDQAEFLVRLDEALGQIGGENPRMLRVVECRYFGGLTEEETAQALAVSPRTVRRDWTRARARLAVALGGSGRA